MKVGDRVYVNPGVSCGCCHACRGGQPINCAAYTFLGYFGFGPNSSRVFADYPYAGFAEHTTAPALSIVKLPDSMPFEAAARLGYMGTAYSALRKADVRAGKSVLISGATSTLGLGAVLLALAMGATKVFGLARSVELLEPVRAIDPRRVQVMSLAEPGAEGRVGNWIRSHTRGLGADVFIDAVGPGAPHSTSLAGIGSLRRGGRMVDIGGISEPLPLDMFRLMCFQISVIGSLWFDAPRARTWSRCSMPGPSTCRCSSTSAFRSTGSPTRLPPSRSAAVGSLMSSSRTAE